MPQPDSTRRSHDVRHGHSTRTWPLDPAAPDPAAPHPASWVAPRMAGPARKPPHEDPQKDGRTPHDPDGNEELEREQRESPPGRHTSTERGSLTTPRSPKTKTHGTDGSKLSASGTNGEPWDAEPFTPDDEVADTLPEFPRHDLQRG